MFISIAEAVSEAPAETWERLTSAHKSLEGMPGFRWAMLLSSLDTAGTLASASMWLTPEQASALDAAGLGAAAGRGFDVTTARGSMTPATHVAIVEWEVPDGEVARFTNRWNAVYHRIEDRIGSRLLRNLAAAGRYAGLHAVTDESNLNPEALGAAITDGEGLAVSPVSMRRFQVTGLTGG